MNHFLQPPIKGVVLQTYGAGNGPDSRKDLLALFKKASDNGVLILNITQCVRGYVSATYAAGKVCTGSSQHMMTLELIGHST